MTVYSAAVVLGLGVGTVAVCDVGDPYQTFYVHNFGATAARLGHAAAVDASAYPLASGGTMVVTLESGEALYGFASGGTCEIRVLAVTGSR